MTKKPKKKENKAADLQKARHPAKEDDLYRRTKTINNQAQKWYGKKNQISRINITNSLITSLNISHRQKTNMKQRRPTSENPATSEQESIAAQAHSTIRNKCTLKKRG